MKKLSLLLFAFCVSIAGWAQNNADAPYLLNPYAYDLTSSWDESTQKLTINFKLNSAPNLHFKDVNNNDVANGRGIQVFLVDSRNNEYYICGPSQDDIRAAHGKTGGRHGSYSYVIDLSSGLDRNGNLIPRNEDLTWKVKVNGRKSLNVSIPIGGDLGSQNYSKPRYWPWKTNDAYQKRLISHSIDVVTNPQAPNFGRIMITDGIIVSTETGAHGDTYDSHKSKKGGRGVYILEPDFVNYANGGKRVAINTDVENGGFVDPLEPRGICISDNGRIFVSSASQTSSTAVWELSSNYQNWTEILKKSTLDNRRVVSIDAKGTGDAITLLLLCLPTNANTPLTCYEYNIQNKTLTSVSLPKNVTSITPYIEGINIQVKVQYASNGDIWVGLGNKYGSRVVRVKDNTYRFYGSNNDGSWGGEAFVIKDNLMIKSSRTSGDADILFEKLDDGSNYFSENITGEGIGMDSWITDFAIDYADNVFVASNYHGRVIPISMPYDGVRYTPAPSNQKIKLRKAVPNIMAMDLNCVPNGNNPSYEFSFVTNTKPTIAEIRFYRKEKSANMLSNINTIHADNYNKDSHTTILPDYVYTFPQTELKQGRMSVILDMVGGARNERIITDALPPGELYWTVYVETEKSTCFAPIYRQPYKKDPHYRLHAVVNNYPETDQFGWLYAANYRGGLSDNNSIMVYKFSEDGNVDDLNSNNVHNSTRYELAIEYMNSSFTKGDTKLNNQRRMIVAPDGKLFIADEGTHNAKEILPGTLPIFAENANGTTPTYQYGGIKVWDPKTPDKLSLFSNNKLNSSSAVTLYEHNGVGWRLYATNTYNEYAKHNKSKDEGYTKEEQAGIYGWNGFVRYENLTVNDKGIFSWTGNTYASTTKTEYALGRGDASGNMSIIAIDKGLWMCQHREHTYNIKYNLKEPLADNIEAYVLSFVPYGSSERTWKSSTTLGVQWSSGAAKVEEPVSEISQKATGKLQSTPGAGMAYKALRNASGNILNEYLYVVNHDGNIAKFEITWKDSKTPILSDDKNANIEILETPGNTKGDIRAEKDNFTTQVWHTAAISSMNFDYAGNLVTTTGVAYYDMNLMNNETDTMPEGAQNIIVYTMPYDRTNAQEIRASENRILIPERLAQFDMTRGEIKDIVEDHKTHQTGTCAIDLYRPMQGGMFNTICVPFDLDINNIPNGHPLFGVEIKKFTDAKIESIGGEKILTLVFGDVQNGIMKANEPHIIKPTNNIKGILELDWRVPLAKDTSLSRPKYLFDDNNSIIFQGILPKTQVDALYDPTTNLPLRLILVADNRLAVLTGNGEMYGFRGYFDLAKPLPPGTVAKISAKKDTPTNTTIVVDGKKVNIEKYLREGRVYIRVGDSLYTVDGQLVK